MKYVKTNKIIAFILSMVMILSNILPNISNDVFGINFSSSTNGSIEPVVEYSDSGQAEPERETTGTDLDNFEFSLKYGTIEDEIENDTLFVKDQSNKINATLRIEYTGNQSYNAGDLSMTFNYPTGIFRNAPDYDILSDVGAELKGSGSGRGDWYYEKELGKLTFTNKQATTGSFTSSIEIVLDMPSIRFVVNKFSSTMSSSFSVNGIETILDSKTLFFSAETTHDELELLEIVPLQYIYNTYSNDSSTYNCNDYALNDYYIMNVRFKGKLSYFSRGFDMTDIITLPEGCFFTTSKSNIYTDNGKITTSNDNSWNDNMITLSIAIPKNVYSVGEKITISWNKKATFFDTNEIWEDTISKEFEILETKITVNTINAYTYKGASVDQLYFSELESDKGTDFDWVFIMRQNYAYKSNSDNKDEFAPVHTEITDKDTALYRNPTSSYVRDFEEDEYYLTYLRLRPQGIEYDECKVQIYAKKFSESDYTLISDFIYNNEDITIDLDPLQKYAHFKVVIDGNWAKSFGRGNDCCLQIRAGVHCKLFNKENCNYIRNEANYKEVLKNGAEVSAKLGCYIKLINERIIVYAKPEIKSKSGTIKDSKIIYTPTFSGFYQVHGKSAIKQHKIHFDITYPSYIDFDFSNGINNQLSFGGEIYKEDDGSLITGNKNDYYDVNYDITQDGKTKKLNVEINIKDGYYIAYPSPANGSYDNYYPFYFKPTMYINLDTYILLLNFGKLPSSFSLRETVYKGDDTPGYIWDNTQDSKSIYPTIPSLAGNTYQGVEKFVNIGSGFTKDLSATTPGGDYSYKLRIAGGETTLDNIVLYDNLEEAYGDNSYWKGTFNGLDTTLLDMICEGEDYNYTVYYSKDKNQEFDLSDAGWIKEADWTDALADVKSIAIDLGGIRLNPKSLAYVIVNMKAPENGNPGVKAYNSYAADYKAYDSTTGILMETIKALPSNTTEVIYNENITYTVNKIWDGKASDSAEIKLLANGAEKETITLSADNKWTHTFTDLPVLDDNFSPIEYTVEETPIKKYETSYKTTTDTNGNIKTDITNTRLPDDVYTFTKTWKIEGSEPVELGFIDTSYMTYAEQKEARSGKTFSITATGTDLENATFSVTADSDGLIKIPDEYNNYSDFSFKMTDKNNVIYTCNFKTQKEDPVIPDSITLTASEPGKDKDGNETDIITLTKENNWTAQYSFENDNISFEENNIDGSKSTGLAITFDSNFKTENVSYDYLIIYYVLNNQIYQFGKYGGTSLAGKTLEIPSTDVYFYWHTDSSNSSYYGFKVTDIKKVNNDITASGTVTTLPNYAITELENGVYPESVHGNYGNNVNKIWHYNASNNISIEKVGDNNYSVNIVNTKKQVSKLVSCEITKESVYNITKKWNINSEKIKINVKTENGYDAEYDYINILDEDGNVLEKINFEKLGLIISNNEYKTDKTYTAEVHMKDGKVYKTSINMDKFTIAPIECDLYIDGEVADTFILNEENGWKYTTVSSKKDNGTEISTESHSVKEKTKGEWKSDIKYAENGNNIDYTITNNVEHEIAIATITVSDPEPPVDTGNSNYLWIYLMTLGIGFAGILISRKKKQ